MEIKSVLLITLLLGPLHICVGNKSQSSYNQAVTTCSNSSLNLNRHPRKIPGTDLKTRTFYQVGLKSYPNGVLTWTERSINNYNYVQIDNDVGHFQKYRHGEEWYNDTMWEFIPALHEGQETGWYGLRNRGRQGAYLTWSPSDYSQSSQQAYHIVLEKDSGNRKKSDFFIRPVQVQQNGQTYIQIKLKNLPEGVVTWSLKRYGDRGSYFIEVDDHTDDCVIAHYKEGGEWFEDTLFTFNKAGEKEIVEDNELGELE